MRACKRKAHSIPNTTVAKSLTRKEHTRLCATSQPQQPYRQHELGKPNSALHQSHATTGACHEINLSQHAQHSSHTISLIQPQLTVLSFNITGQGLQSSTRHTLP
ncbi:hypothetical protein KM043_008007 [Ampulex compressa]|nr:hypothetical protein KM043_008007 [Ampulex compressa]